MSHRRSILPSSFLNFFDFEEGSCEFLLDLVTRSTGVSSDCDWSDNEVKQSWSDVFFLNRGLADFFFFFFGESVASEREQSDTELRVTTRGDNFDGCLWLNEDFNFFFLVELLVATWLSDSVSDVSDTKLFPIWDCALGDKDLDLLLVNGLVTSGSSFTSVASDENSVTSLRGIRDWISGDGDLNLTLLEGLANDSWCANGDSSRSYKEVRLGVIEVWTSEGISSGCSMMGLSRFSGSNCLGAFN